jgi:hypothetical protein
MSKKATTQEAVVPEVDVPAVFDADVQAIQGMFGKTSGVKLADVTVSTRDEYAKIIFDADLRLTDEDKKKGKIPFLPGQSIELRLRGTHKLNSASELDGWTAEEFQFTDSNGLLQTKINYTSRLYEFETLDGKKRVGMYSNPFLNRVLSKVPTHAATPAVAKSNPIVKITFVGKTDDKELLKAKYDFELSKGKVNLCIVELEDGIVGYNPYNRKVVNYLSDPRPVLRDGTHVDSMEQAHLDWESIQKANGQLAIADSSANQGGSSAQLSM